MEDLKTNNGQTNTDANRKKFLFVSWQSLSGDLAWQVQKEGHEVKAYIKDPDEQDVYDGILEKVSDWKAHQDWADVIFFDDVGFGDIADSLRQAGKPVFGGSVYTDKLETDREFGQQEMKAVGMNVLPHWDFTDFDEAIKFLKENPGRYVFKPSGDTSHGEKGILFIGHEEDGKDILEVLEHNKKNWSNKIAKFQIQKFASGVEVGVSCFFNGQDFVYPVSVNFEHKKLFPGEIGPSTGEMGTLMYWSPPNQIFNATLAKMRDKLAESKYVGDIDINCIANSKGFYPLEFVCRLGYPAISIQMEGVTSPWGDFIYALAKGENYDLKTKKGFQIGVVVAVPPFPYYNDKVEFSIYKDSSILFKKPNLDGIHLGDVKIIDGDWKLAGQSGYALVVTGANGTVEDARKQVYRRVKNIMLQNMYYRTDIGLRWYHDSDQLQTWGYLY